MRKPDPALDALKKDPQAAQLLRDPKSLSALLSAPETQKLMALLNQSAGSSLQSAAQAAAKGKPQDLMGLLSKVVQSKEGAAAVEGIQKKVKQ